VGTECRITATELKVKLKSIVFPDGENAVNKYIQAFCLFLVQKLDDFFFEEYLTPAMFVEEYFDAMKALEQPEMEPLIAAAAGNVVRAISSPKFAEMAEEMAIQHIVTSGILRKELSRGPWIN
jgi:hypothetical protein